MVKVIDESTYLKEIGQKLRKLEEVTQEIARERIVEEEFVIGHSASGDSLLLNRRTGNTYSLGEQIRVTTSNQLIVYDKDYVDIAMKLAKAYEARIGGEFILLVKDHKRTPDPW